MPLISIILPVYNAGPYLRVLIDSVLAQDHSDFEVLMLDDASTDGSLDIMREYKRDNRFKIFSWTENRGAHAGTLFLLNQARGEFWCYPGADDILSCQFLRERLGMLVGHPNRALVHGRARYIDEQGNLAPPQMISWDIPENMDGRRALETLLQHNYINAPSIMARMDLTRMVLPFFTGAMFYPMDWYLWILLAATGYDFHYDKRELHSYRLHLQSNSLKPEKAGIRSVETRLVTLVALKKATAYSDFAASAWSKYSRCLYLLTLYRIWINRNLPESKRWFALLQTSAARVPRQSLVTEVIKDFLPMILAGGKERKARLHQIFTVSGLALVDEPMFASTNQ